MLSFMCRIDTADMTDHDATDMVSFPNDPQQQKWPDAGSAPSPDASIHSQPRDRTSNQASLVYTEQYTFKCQSITTFVFVFNHTFFIIFPILSDLCLVD